MIELHYIFCAHDVCICICTRLFSQHICHCACIQGDSLQNLSSGLDTVSYRVPLGVCAGIGKLKVFLFKLNIPSV